MTELSTVVINAEELAETLSKAPSDGPSVPLLLDIRTAEEFAAGHIPGAYRLDPSLLNRSAPPMNGLLPAAEDVAAWTAALGLTFGSLVVVYDGSKNTAAARALWVLNTYGFTNVQWLNGGLPAWMSADQPITTDDSAPPTTTPPNSLVANPALVLTKESLLEQFADSNTEHQLVDARTRGEYEGSDVRSERGGRMPGAVHYEWLDMFQSDGKLRPETELRAALSERNLDQDVPAVVYCQSHQRSAVTYVVLKHLGYKQVAALDGAWSNWGNDPATPIEI